MGRPRTYEENAVLESAVELFRERGYEGVSIPDLTTHLGICRQSLYKSFGDKRGLYLAALERYGRREVDARRNLLAAEGSPLENLRTVIRGWAALATRCPGEGCLTVVGIIENRGDPEALAVVEQQVERLEQGFRETLARAQAAGELNPTASPARLARSFTSTVYGLGLLSRLPGSGPRIGDAVAVMLGLLDDAAAKEASKES